MPWGHIIVVHERDVALFDAIASALTATDVEGALEAALREIVRALDLAAGWIWILDPETEPVLSRGGARAAAVPARARADDGRSVLVHGVVRGRRLRLQERRHHRVLAAAPRRARRRRRAHAGLAVARVGRAALRRAAAGDHERLSAAVRASCPKRDLRLLSVTGAQIGLAVERGRLAEEEASAARWAERTRLAREIHDTLAQDLTAIALQLESAQRDVPRDSPAAQRIATALDVARTSMAQARASVLSLRSDPLAGRALPAALAALARRLTSETGMRVTLHESGAPPLPYDVEGELFRIASEALANARLHARASRIEVELERRRRCGRAAHPRRRRRLQPVGARR